MPKIGTERPFTNWFSEETPDYPFRDFGEGEYQLTQAEREQYIIFRRVRFETQMRVLRTLVWIFAGLVVITLAILLLQGFQVGGFSLNSATINLLAASTIGEVAGLLAIAVSAIFGVQKNK